MCGVFGAVEPDLNSETISSALAVLSHRGPDASGSFLDRERGVGLGHTRLAILDLETGDQPLFDRDREVALVCNGEIYDFERLRSELEAEGHHFQTRSDSELIIQLYLKHDLALFEHLRGEFAFLLLDRRRNRLLAARDRFGIKPLFLSRTKSGGWCFASEAKAIFASGLKDPAIDLWNYYENENGSLFRGVYNLPPGTALLLDLTDRSFETLTYWAPDFPRRSAIDRERPFAEWAAELDRSLTEAVRLRLRADVPVGVYLSGGIDSALVAAKVCRLTQRPPLAFTVSFSDVPPKYDEGQSARRIADHLGVDHHVLQVDTAALWANLERCLWHNEAPITNFAPVAKCMLSALATRHVKVVLTGEGSDEVFLGYRLFKRRMVSAEPSGPGGALEATIDRLGTRVLGWLKRGLVGLFVRGRPGRSISLDSLGAVLPKQSSDRSQLEGRPALIRLQYRRLRTHLHRVILSAYADRMEMAHSVEGRVPFLDHHLFCVAREIPIRYKIWQGREKHIVREVARGLVPDEVVDRTKWPFSTPQPAFESGSSPAVNRIRERYLTREAVREAGLFRWYGVRALLFLRRFPRTRRYADRWLFTVCCLQILHRQFVEGEVRVDPWAPSTTEPAAVPS